MSTLLHGSSIKWYESGHLKSFQNYTNGELNGIETTWHDNLHQPIIPSAVPITHIERQTTWVMGDKYGPETQWYHTGNRLSETTWVENKKHGTETYWFDNGNISGEIPWFEGVKDGIEKSYFRYNDNYRHLTYENGVLVESILFVDGQMIPDEIERPASSGVKRKLFN